MSPTSLAVRADACTYTAQRIGDSNISLYIGAGVTLDLKQQGALPVCSSLSYRCKRCAWNRLYYKVPLLKTDSELGAFYQ